MSILLPVCALLASGCVAALPPTQSSIGVLGDEAGVRVRGSAGAHVKAADRGDRLDVDLGAGYVFEHAASSTAHGTYVAVARRLPIAGRRDLWLGGRFEQFWRVDPGEPRQGVTVRMALRHHVGGVAAGSSDGRGAVGMFGALAVGAHTELGVRVLEGGGGAVMVSAGLSLDLPALFGAARR